MPTRKELANAIRALSMDAVQKANSGHPGAPMGMADIAEVLWNDYIVHNPANPTWFNRDRFVLSNGHGSMLIYSLLHLTGYDLPIEQLKQFRQLHSQTPGHPEYGDTVGVETTTGPLGQGLTNAVGMAIAEKVLAAQFNHHGFEIVDHYTYVFMGDGCLMEGISHEACSLAGTLGLGKLITFYDDNGISIDGKVEGWFTDDTPKRFDAYGWHVVSNVDGHDPEAIKKAIDEARSVDDRPSIICCKTIIGCGAPNLGGSAKTHGEALGEAEIAATRENLQWSHEPFVIPDEISQAWNAKEKGETADKQWQNLLSTYKKEFPEQADELIRRCEKQLPKNWSSQADLCIKEIAAKAESIASRKASQNALNAFGPLLPELLGGSADLAGSNLTLWKDSKGISRKTAEGNYLYYGVREFGMSAIMTGIGLHGGFIPYGATFLVFADYARNAVRMASLIKVRSIFVYTHDSIGLGEDGPTHQPIEHVASLRIIPNLSLWRPCDAVESAVAWKLAIERTTGPTAMIFSRQTLPHQNRNEQTMANIQRGGYVLSDCEGLPQVIIIATGSEVSIAMDAAKELDALGKNIRVVSMPSTDTFDAQDASYQASVLPPQVTNRLVVEAGVSDSWYKYVGIQGKVMGINQFGASAPGPDVYKHFGFTVSNVTSTVTAML